MYKVENMKTKIWARILFGFFTCMTVVSANVEDHAEKLKVSRLVNCLLQSSRNDTIDLQKATKKGSKKYFQYITDSIEKEVKKIEDAINCNVDIYDRTVNTMMGKLVIGNKKLDKKITELILSGMDAEILVEAAKKGELLFAVLNIISETFRETDNTQTKIVKKFVERFSQTIQDR